MDGDRAGSKKVLHSILRAYIGKVLSALPDEGEDVCLEETSLNAPVKGSITGIYTDLGLGLGLSLRLKNCGSCRVAY